MGHPGRLVDAANGVACRRARRLAQPDRAVVRGRALPPGVVDGPAAASSALLRRSAVFYMPAQVLDYEGNLRDSLYVKPQKLKGNTAGRARTQSYAGALMQA